MNIQKNENKKKLKKNVIKYKIAKTRFWHICCCNRVILITTSSFCIYLKKPEFVFQRNWISMHKVLLNPIAKHPEKALFNIFLTIRNKWLLVFITNNSCICYFRHFFFRFHLSNIFTLNLYIYKKYKVAIKSKIQQL